AGGDGAEPRALDAGRERDRAQALVDDLAGGGDVGGGGGGGGHPRQGELGGGGEPLPARRGGGGRGGRGGEWGPVRIRLAGRGRGEGGDVEVEGGGVGEGVEGQVGQGDATQGREAERPEDHQQAVAQRKVDDGVEHGFLRQVSEVRGQKSCGDSPGRGVRQ